MQKSLNFIISDWQFLSNVQLNKPSNKSVTNLTLQPVNIQQ